jgi:hypothetical protein
MAILHGRSPVFFQALNNGCRDCTPSTPLSLVSPHPLSRIQGFLSASFSSRLLHCAHTTIVRTPGDAPFPSVGRVVVNGDAFRWVAAFWDY